MASKKHIPVKYPLGAMRPRGEGNVPLGAEKRGRKRKTHNSILSQAHHKVVEYYCRGESKKDAMLKAGYSLTMATKAAWKVFEREDVKAAIEERRYRMKSRSHQMIDRIVEEIANIAFFNIGEFIEVTKDGQLIYDFGEATMEDFAAIGEVTVEEFVEGKGKDATRVRRVKVKPYNKQAGLDSLARIYGMFEENVNLRLGGKEGGTFEDRIKRARERVRQEDKVIEGEHEREEA